MIQFTKVNQNGALREFDGMWESSLTDSTSKGKPDTSAVDVTSRIMTIEQIYKSAMQQAIKADLRGEAAVKKKLKKLTEKYNKLDKQKKADFDEESLVNPYADSRMFVKDPQQKVKKVLTGIFVTPANIFKRKYGN